MKSYNAMKRIIVIMIVSLLASCFAANGQSMLERLGQRAKNAVENKIGEKVEQGVNDVLDGKKKKKDKADKQTADPVSQDAVAMPDAKVPAQPKKQVETAYAKSDFVPGDEIFFEDTFENEQLGEFPSQWDLMSGYAEVGSVDGRKVIAFTDNGFAEIQPLMNDQQHFLPDVFTLEFDMYLQTGDGLGGDELEIAFGNPDLPNWNGRVEYVVVSFRDDGYSRYGWTVQKPNGGDIITGEKLLCERCTGNERSHRQSAFAFLVQSWRPVQICLHLQRPPGQGCSPAL